MNKLDTICKRINTEKVGPELKLLWRMKIKRDSKLFEYGEKLVVLNDKSVVCLNLYSGKELWSFNVKKSISNGFFSGSKFLFYDTRMNFFAFDCDSEKIIPFESLDGCLIPVGAYKNYIVEEEVFDTENLTILSDVPKYEWTGSIGNTLIKKNTDKNILLYNLDSKSLDELDVKVQGSLLIKCLHESEFKVIVEKCSEGFTGYNFPNFNQIWKYDDNETAGKYIYTEKLVGFSNLEENRYRFLDKETGKKIFDEPVYWQKFLTGDKYLWSSTEDKQYFVCHDIESSEVVNKFKKEHVYDIISKVANDCLLVECKEGKELVCYQGGH